MNIILRNESGPPFISKNLFFNLLIARGSEDDQRRCGDASGEGEQECWFAEGGCLESSEMRVGVGEIAVRVG